MRRYNLYILFKRDEDPSMNMFPDSILEWDSTQDLNYLKFLTNKSMNITDKGVEKMLNELQKEYEEKNKPVQPTGPRKRGRPKKQKAENRTKLTSKTNPENSLMAKLEFAMRINEQQEKSGKCAICPLCPGMKANQKHFISECIISAWERKDLMAKLE